jgi:hypothetical protein
VTTGDVAAPSVVEKLTETPGTGFRASLTSRATTKVVDVPSALIELRTDDSVSVSALNVTFVCAVSVLP